MISGKKIIAWVILCSLISTHFSFSYASWESLTTEEKTKIETEILKLQWQLLTHSQTFLEKMTSNFKKLTHYEEKGNSKIEFEMDQSMFGKWFTTLDIKNYTIKNALLDSDISWDISLKTRFQPTYGTWIELDLSTLASMISKDGDIYSLLKDFNFQVNDENIKEILQQVKEKFQDNKYLKLPSDQNSQLGYQYINNFRPDAFLNGAEKIFSQPLLQAYKKSWDKYLLIPTKFACDTYFELDKTLNLYNSWYTPKTCSSSVYKTFLKEFLSMWELYLILWKDNNTFWYTQKKDGTDITLEIVYTSQDIVSTQCIIIPDQKKYKNEWFTFSYKKNDNIKIDFNADSGKMIWKLDAKLDANNHYISLQSKLNFNNDVVWEFQILDKKISWFYTIKERGYDYNSDDWDYILKNIYGVKITGKLNENNTLEKLNIKAAGVDVKTKEVFLKAKTSYENGNYIFDISSVAMLSKFDMKGTGYISQETFTLDSEYNFNEMYTWDFNMNYDTSNNKNNLYFYFDTNEWEKKIIKFLMSNTATRNYKEDIKVEIPSDFVEFDINEVWELLNTY